MSYKRSLRGTKVTMRRLKLYLTTSTGKLSLKVNQLMNRGTTLHKVTNKCIRKFLAWRRCTSTGSYHDYDNYNRKGNAAQNHKTCVAS